MNRYKTAANLLACFILLAATLRALTFWAADPMLAYANNYDQIRILRTFGIQPRDAKAELYAGTPDQPWRYFVRADKWHSPTYPSSDLLFKSIQYGTMAAFAANDGSMDIKASTAPLLIAWLLGIWVIFRKLLPKPLAALSFAGWMLIVADPINLLFLNTWYAEFSAFAVSTLFVGVAWLWLCNLISLRGALIWGAAFLTFISLNRNQYMFLLAAVALLAGIALACSRTYRPYLKAAPVKTGLIAIACLLPVLVYSSASSYLRIANSANRIDTVFGALLPASKDPANMLKHMDLPPECLQFSGQNWYSIPTTEYQTHCPKVMKLSLGRIAYAVARDPASIITVIGKISQGHGGFLVQALGQVEGGTHAQLNEGAKPYLQSLDPVFRSLSLAPTRLLLWISILGPVLAALIAWTLKQQRWTFMFLLSGLLFNYALFSSILGDGYFELERHAILCFTFGSLFFFLVGNFIASPPRKTT